MFETDQPVLEKPISSSSTPDITPQNSSLADSQLLARRAFIQVYGSNPTASHQRTIQMVTLSLERAARHPDFIHLAANRKLEAAIHLIQQFQLYERLTDALNSLRSNVGTATHQLLANAFGTGFNALQCVLDANCPQTRILTQAGIAHEILSTEPEYAGHA